MRSMEEQYSYDSETRAQIRTAISALEDVMDREFDNRTVAPEVEDCIEALRERAAQLVRRYD